MINFALLPDSLAVVKNGLGAAKAYYLLGAKNEQYAVYHGVQYKPSDFPELSTWAEGHYGTRLQNKNLDPKYNDYNICQIMYPAEYNLYGVGSSPVMSFKKDAGGNWEKHFYVKDYLHNDEDLQNEFFDILKEEGEKWIK